MLEEEGEADSEQQPGDDAELVGAHLVRDERGLRRLGLLDDPDVGRLQLGLQAGLLRLGEEIRVELTVRVDLALEHGQVDRLAVRRLRLALHGLEARREAGFLRERRPVLALGRPRDVADLGAELVLRRLDLRADPDHVRVPIAERLGEPCLLLLEGGELDLQRLHRLARQHEAEALQLGRRRVQHLVVERLLGDPIRPGLEHGAVQGLELLLDEPLLLLLVHEPLALAVLLEALLRLLHLRLLLLQPVRQPAGGLGRRGEAQLESLLDVELGQAVDGIRRDARVVGAEVEVHEPRARDGLDLHSRTEGRGGGRQGYLAGIGIRDTAEAALQPLPRAHHRTGGQLRRLLQSEPFDGPFRQGPAAQELVLRLQIVVPRLHQLHELLVREHVRGVSVDQDLGGGAIDRPCRVVVQDGHEQADRKAGDDEAAPLVQHSEVVSDVGEDVVLGQRGRSPPLAVVSLAEKCLPAKG